MRFTEKQLKKLRNNENVIDIVNEKIYYTEEFKEKAIQEYKQGKTARQIFEEAGFNLLEISDVPDYASRILSKWRKKKDNIHYPKIKVKESKTKYQKMAARLEYLEAENEFLKKLSALCKEYGE